MHPLLTQLSAIAALLVLMNQLWGAASIERTLAVSVMTGLVVYSVLLAGQLTLRYVLAQSEPAAEPSPAPPPAETDAEVATAPTPSATS